MRQVESMLAKKVLVAINCWPQTSLYPQVLVALFWPVDYFDFGALTLLAGCQERRLACRKTDCRSVSGCELTGAVHVLLSVPVVIATTWSIACFIWKSRMVWHSFEIEFLWQHTVVTSEALRTCVSDFPRVAAGQCGCQQSNPCTVDRKSSTLTHNISYRATSLPEVVFYGFTEKNFGWRV